VFRQRSRKARKETTMVKNPVDDKIAQIGKIVEVMLDTWDLPADCNEGELFTYAERLHDRIAAGDSKDKLYAYLSEVQVEQLEMAKSDAFRTIVDRAVELTKHCR
jgi:Na+/phosphate symporter